MSIFAPLAAIVPHVPVRVTGAWTSRMQLEYASTAQSGSGQGPYVPVTYWSWSGVVESDVPLAGLVFLADEAHLAWVKSNPPVPSPTISLSAGATTSDSSSVAFGGAFHGSSTGAFPAEAPAGVPASIRLGDGETTTGISHTVGSLGNVVLGVVLLPAVAVRIGRNRLWRLREDLAERLPADLRELMTRRRTGRILLASTRDCRCCACTRR